MQLDIFKPKAPPVLGIDISSSSVKMVELAAVAKGGTRVERYAIEPLPRDAVLDGNIANLEVVAEAVRRAWKRLATRTRHCALALPSAAVISKKIIVPAGLREQEMEIQVESEANQYIPFALEEVNLDFEVIGPAPSSPEEVEVMIAASRKEKVEDRVAVAEAAGLKATVMDVESFAMQAAYELIRGQLPGAALDQNVAIVDIGANTTNVMVLRNGEAVYTREQAFGGGQLTQDIARHYSLPTDEAEVAKRTGGLPESYEAEVLRPFMDNCAGEVQRAIQFFFSSTPYNSVEHIVLAGGAAVLPGLDEVVGAHTRIDTRVANPFVDMQVSPHVQPRKLIDDAPALMIACGLALRRFDE